METMIVAHRGESMDAPENTLAAINLAWNRGAKAVEVDVHLSSDNKVVVFHDYNTKRLAGMNKPVKQQSFDELNKLDVGAWKDIQWKGEKIPLLQEVLETVSGDKKLIVEIKCGEEIIPFLKTELGNSGLDTDQVELIGFDLNVMIETKKVFPGHKVLWLLDLDYVWWNRIFRPSIRKAISKTKEHNLDGLNVWAGNMLNQNMIQEVHHAGLLIYCWTVNDITKAEHLIKWGIDAITTDGAAWLTSHLNQNK